MGKLVIVSLALAASAFGQYFPPGGGGGGSTIHSITLSIDGGGSVIATGAVGQFQSTKFACTINQVDISSDQSGSITIDVWKAAGAIPTSGNKISASAPIALSSAQIALGTLDISTWTKTVASGDVFGFSIATASTVTKATATIWCN